jgi:hypothetical protein
MICKSWYYRPCACEQIWASLVWQAQNFKMVAQNEYNALYWATSFSLCDGGFHEDLHGISSLLGEEVKSKMKGFTCWKPNLLY